MKFYYYYFCVIIINLTSKIVEKSQIGRVNRSNDETFCPWINPTIEHQGRERNSWKILSLEKPLDVIKFSYRFLLIVIIHNITQYI